MMNEQYAHYSKRNYDAVEPVMACRFLEPVETEWYAGVFLKRVPANISLGRHIP